MVKTKNYKMIQTKYKYLAVLTIVSLNFYSQKIDTVKIVNQLWSAKKITYSKIQNGELIIGAAKQLQTAIEKHPNDISLKANLAHVYLITGQFEKAIFPTYSLISILFAVIKNEGTIRYNILVCSTRFCCSGRCPF